MENKKLDLQTIIGYVLIAGLLFWMIYNMQTQQAEAQKNIPAEKEVVENPTPTPAPV
jgi:YidC/Oxa1 family membrane protein insertase